MKRVCLCVSWEKTRSRALCKEQGKIGNYKYDAESAHCRGFIFSRMGATNLNSQDPAKKCKYSNGRSPISRYRVNCNLDFQSLSIWFRRFKNEPMQFVEPAFLLKYYRYTFGCLSAMFSTNRLSRHNQLHRYNLGFIVYLATKLKTVKSKLTYNTCDESLQGQIWILFILYSFNQVWCNWDQKHLAQFYTEDDLNLTLRSRAHIT